MTGQLKNLSDKELIIKVKSSDANAFKEFYYRYFENIYKYILFRINNETNAKDLSQDVFVKIWENRKNLDPESNIKSYIFRSANNLLIDKYRKDSRQNNVSIENHIATLSLDEKINDDRIDMIYKILNTLSDELRSVFLLNKIEGFKQYEIAEILDISLRTVESRISKVMGILKNKLKKIKY